MRKKSKRLQDALLYADDTTVFVQDLDSIPELLVLLNNFKIFSGLNATKTEGMWFGSWKNNLETPFGFRWPRDPIKAVKQLSLII